VQRQGTGGTVGRKQGKQWPGNGLKRHRKERQKEGRKKQRHKNSIVYGKEH